MTNAKSFIKFCIYDANNQETKNKILEFNKRMKKDYIKRIKMMLLYFLIMIIFFIIIFGIIEKETNILKIISDIAPIFLLMFIVFLFICIILIIYYFKNFYKVESKIDNAKSIKVSDKSYTFIYEKGEYTANSRIINSVCFMDNGTNPAHTYEVGKNHPNVYYDKLIKGHIYHFYAINNKKLFVIDDIYN